MHEATKTAEPLADGPEKPEETTLVEWLDGAKDRFKVALDELARAKDTATETKEELRNALLDLHGKTIVFSGVVTLDPKPENMPNALIREMEGWREEEVMTVVQSYLDASPNEAIRIYVAGEMHGLLCSVRLDRIHEVVE